MMATTSMMTQILGINHTRHYGRHFLQVENPNLHAGGMVVYFGPKVGHIGPKWDDSETISYRIKVQFDFDPKSPGFVTYGANLTHIRS